MKLKQWLYLIFEVVFETIVTGFLITLGILCKIFPRRQNCVKDEVVLITGTGHGLGKRIAMIFGKLEAKVICWDKDEKTNMTTVQNIINAGGRAEGYTVDVTDRVSVLRTAKIVQEKVGIVTILINNAGIYPVKGILDWNQEELNDLLNVNFLAHFWTMQAFVPAMMKANKGHVVAISSAASFAPVSNEVPYSSSKAAVTGLMEGLIQELQLNPNNKVKVTCVHPYYTATRLDLPVVFDLRFDRMCPDFVAQEIVKGIREGQEMITIPRFMYFWITFLRCLPQTSRRRWRSIFRTVVYPQPAVTKQITDVQLSEECSPCSHSNIKSVESNKDKSEHSCILNDIQCNMHEVVQEKIHL